jgi:hypothetical protein
MTLETDAVVVIDHTLPAGLGRHHLPNLIVAWRADPLAVKTPLTAKSGTSLPAT